MRAPSRIRVGRAGERLGAMYTLRREQFVATDLEQAWSFIQNPANLDRITPDDLRFQIVSPVPAEMHDGLMIEYRIRIPLLGTTRWLTEIKHVRPLQSFVDEQRHGPYSLWYHCHELFEVDGGVLFRDTIHYRVPFWIFGRIAHALFVRRTLERIFDHRGRRFVELLGGAVERAVPHGVERDGREAVART